MGGLVAPEEFDYFHEMIITQEFGRHASRGFGDGLSGGLYLASRPCMMIVTHLFLDRHGDRSSPSSELRQGCG